jgi:hypothetical protein
VRAFFRDNPDRPDALDFQQGAATLEDALDSSYPPEVKGSAVLRSRCDHMISIFTSVASTLDYAESYLRIALERAGLWHVDIDPDERFLLARNTAHFRMSRADKQGRSSASHSS